MNDLQGKCYLCGSGTEPLLSFPWLVRCSSCGLVFNPDLSVDTHAVSNQFYDAVNVKHRRRIRSVLLRIARTRWQWFIHQVPLTTGNLLEVGCGTGEFIATAAKAGWSVEGFELSDNFRFAAKEWYELNVRNEDLSQLDILETGFDVVCLFHAFEHLIDPLAFLKQIDRLLKPGGWLFMVVPNLDSRIDHLFGKDSPTLIKRDHFFHYDPGTLRAMIARAGFDMQRVTTREPDHHIWTSLYGYLGSWQSRPASHASGSADRPGFSVIDQFKSNLPYWLGKIFLIVYFPVMLGLQRADQGHEIYLLCQKRFWKKPLPKGCNHA